MAKKVNPLSRFIGGISEFDKESTVQDGYSFGQSIDVRSNPRKFSLLPRTIKESGSVIQALPKWAEHVSSCSRTWIYDEAGNIYKRDSSGNYTLLRTVANSHGNGMKWFGEDNFIYYTSDTLVGRVQACSDNPTFVDDYFGSQGGTALNTHSLVLNGTSQYASRADTATLSITGNLSLEAQIKPSSLPSSGNTMTIVSKWTESGNARSYKLGIGTVSNFFGDGSDGALVISANTTDAPIDSACTGTSGAYTLSATNASFAAGQKVYIHQTRGTNAGQNQLNKIQSYTAGTITLVNPLNATYTTGAQVLVAKQQTTITVNTGITWTAKAWNGTVGGILPYFATTTITINGTVSALGCGFRGGSRPAQGNHNPGLCGESYLGTWDAAQRTANYGAGGGGTSDSSPPGHAGNAGGGAGHTIPGTGGGTGHATGGAAPGDGGQTYGGQDLTAAVFLGSGGGSGSNSYNSSSDGGRGGYGGTGGGFVLFACPTGITFGASGLITVVGQAGQIADLKHASGAGGAGAGGSCLIYQQTGAIGTNQIDASPGAYGYNTNGFGIPGGNAGYGRVQIDYLTSYSGDSFPLLWAGSPNTSAQTSSRTTTSLVYATLDATLGSSSGYTLFLSISSNGTNSETFTKPADIITDAWQHVAATWTQSTSTAELFLNGVSLGTVVGALTSISDNGSTFNIGIDKDSSGNPQHYLAAKIDEQRTWAAAKTSEDYLYGINKHINTASTGLQAYYQFNSVATDSTANANNLTLTGSPSYSTDVPFSAPTTRVDIDQAASTAGDTYALTTAISESSADKKSFTPARDPQKSLMVDVVAKGTGDWTLTIHDSFNNTIASKTYTNAQMSTGEFEFVFDSVWRPLTNFTNSYHFHLTSTVADGTVRTSSSNDLSTVKYTTYYQFLVEDTGFHPIERFLQFLVFGNERYIAKLEATTYEPNKIALPAGYRVRCFGYWQEYLAIGVIRGDSVTEQDEGRVYFWDGISPTYNFYVPVPQGGVTALLGAKGKLYIWAGYQGDVLVYEGGNSVEKLRRLPFMESNKYAEMYPAAVTMWKSLIHFGAVGNSNSTSIYRGVYAYGSTNYKYDDILTFDYPISSGRTQPTDVRIGLVTTVNQKLLIGWGDATGYGIDYVDASNACYPTGSIEFLKDDADGNIWKEKLSQTMVVKTATMATGQTVTPKYRLDDTTAWTSGDALTSSSPDTTLARQVFYDERNYEAQYGIDLASSSGTSPTIKGAATEVDYLQSEGRV